MSSWITVRDQLVQIVEGTVPATLAGGKPTKFRHRPDTRPQLQLQERTFNLLITSMAQVGATFARVQRRFRYGVDVEVTYKAMTSIADTYEVIALDHQELSKRIPDGSLWGRPDSGIRTIFGEGDITTPADIEISEADLEVRVRYHFIVEFDAA